MKQPFSWSHINHYPVNGWRLSLDPTQYMPYEVEAEHNLFDLSESEVYEGVLQLAAERQLLQYHTDEAGHSEVEVELFFMEPEAVVPREKASPKGASKVNQMRQELKHEKETYRELRCSRKRRTVQTDSQDEEETGDDTSDDERVDRRAKRQRHVVRQKEAELQRVLAVAAIEQRIQRERKKKQKEAQRQQLQEIRAEKERRKKQKAALRQQMRAERKQRWQLIEEEETHSDSFDSGVDMDEDEAFSI